MKIINEKGRLFGIINPVDLVIILVAVLAVAGIGYKVIKTGVSQTAQAPKQATIVVHVRGASTEVVEGILATDIVGQEIVNGTTEVGATITGVNRTDYATQVATDEGVLVNAVDPVRDDLTFTITGTATVSGDVYSIGTQEIRVGKSYNIKTALIEISGVIESVVITDKK